MKTLLIAALLTLAACHSERPQTVPALRGDNCLKGGPCVYDDGQPK